jgi:hypothetical protein
MIFQKTFTENTSGNILLTDMAGNTGTAPVVITNIDTIAPTCGIRSYEPTTATSGNVVATLSGSTDLGGSLLQIGDIVKDCTLTENATTCSVTINDHAGNTTTCTSNTVNTIDRNPPWATQLEYSPTIFTTGGVTATLVTNEAIFLPSEWD